MSSLRLIIGRELHSYLGQKSSLIGMIILPVIILAVGVGFRFMTSSGAFDEASTLAVTPQTKVYVPVFNAAKDQLGVARYDIIDKPTADEARAAVDSEEATYALVESETGHGLVVVSDQEPSQIDRLVFQGTAQSIALSDYLTSLGGSMRDFTTYAESVTVNIEVSDSEESGTEAGKYVIAYIVITVLTVLLTSGSTAVGTSIIEEKSSRVVELILATVKPSTLIAGKVIGSAVSTIVFFVPTLISIAVAAWVSGIMPPLPVTFGSSMIWSFAFLIVGYLFGAFMVAALASRASRPEDLQATIAPFTITILLVFYGALASLFFDPHSTLTFVASFIPLVSTVMAPLAITMGILSWWQGLISFALSCVACYVVVRLGGRIYSSSVLHYGAKRSLRQAIRGSK